MLLLLLLMLLMFKYKNVLMNRWGSKYQSAAVATKFESRVKHGVNNNKTFFRSFQTILYSYEIKIKLVCVHSN